MESIELMPTSSSASHRWQFTGLIFIRNDQPRSAQPIRFQEKNLFKDISMKQKDDTATMTTCSNSSNNKNERPRQRRRRRKRNGIREESYRGQRRRGKIMTTRTLGRWSLLIILVSVLDQVTNVWSVPAPFSIFPISSNSPSTTPTQFAHGRLSPAPSSPRRHPNVTNPVSFPSLAPIWSLPTGFPTRTIQPSPNPSLQLPELDFYPSAAPTEAFSLAATIRPTIRPRKQQHSVAPTPTVGNTEAGPLPLPTAAPSIRITSSPSRAPRVNPMPSTTPLRQHTLVPHATPKPTTTAPLQQQHSLAPSKKLPISLRSISPTETPTHTVGETSAGPLPAPTSIPSRIPSRRPASLFPQHFAFPSSAPTLSSASKSPSSAPTLSPPSKLPTKRPTPFPQSLEFPSSAPTLPGPPLATGSPSKAPVKSRPTRHGHTAAPTRSFGDTSTVPVVLPTTFAPSVTPPRPTKRPTRLPQSFAFPSSAPTLPPPSKEPTKFPQSLEFPSSAPTLAGPPLETDSPSKTPVKTRPTRHGHTAAPTRSFGDTSTFPVFFPTTLVPSVTPPRPTKRPTKRPTRLPQSFAFPSSAPTLPPPSKRPTPFPQSLEFPSSAPTLAGPPLETGSPSKAPIKSHPTSRAHTALPTYPFGDTSTVPVVFPTTIAPSVTPQPPPTTRPHQSVPFHVPVIIPTTVPIPTRTVRPVTKPTSKPKTTTTFPTMEPTELPFFVFLPSTAPTLGLSSQPQQPVPSQPTPVFQHTVEPTPTVLDTSTTTPIPYPTGLPTVGPSLPTLAPPSARPHRAPYVFPPFPSQRTTGTPTHTQGSPLPLPTGIPSSTISPFFFPSAAPTLAPPSKRPHRSPEARPNARPHITAVPTREAVDTSSSPFLLPSGIPTILPSTFPQLFSFPSPAPTLAFPSRRPHQSPVTTVSPHDVFFPSAAPTLPPPSQYPQATTPTVTKPAKPVFDHTTAPTPTIASASSAPFQLPPQFASFQPTSPVRAATPSNKPARKPASPSIASPTVARPIAIKPSVTTPTAPQANHPTAPQQLSLRPHQVPVAPSSTSPSSTSPTIAPIVVTPSPSASPTTFHTASPQYDLQTLLLPGAQMQLIGALPFSIKSKNDWLTLTGDRIAAEVVAILTGNLESVSVTLNITSLSPPLEGGRRRLIDVFVTERQLMQSSSVDIVFDVSIYLRSALTTNPQDLMNYVGGGFSTSQDLANYLMALRSTNDTAFANVYNITLSLPFITSVNGVQEGDGHGMNAGLIAGIVVASLIGVTLVALFFYLRRQRRIGSAEEKEEILPASETMIGPNSVDDNEFTSEINLDLKTDISTLGDPIEPSAVVGGPDHSVADSFSLDFDFQKAYHRNENTSGSESNGSNSNMMVLKDDDTFDLQYYSQEHFEVDAPSGMLGLVLETSADGVPTVHAIKHTSPIVNQVHVGDRLLSVDGEDVTIMLASDVSRLIASRRDNFVRRFVLSRPPNNNKQVAPNDDNLRPPSP